MVKSNLNNSEIVHLDEVTLRNMHAIGINFQIKSENRLKPFESKLARTRNWRKYFGTEMKSKKRVTTSNV